MWHRHRWSVIETKLNQSLSTSTVSNRQPAVFQRSTLQCTNKPSCSSWCENGAGRRADSPQEDHLRRRGRQWRRQSPVALGHIRFFRSHARRTSCSTLAEVQQWEGLPKAGAAASGHAHAHSHTHARRVCESEDARYVLRQIEIPPQGGLRDASLLISHITETGTCVRALHTHTHTHNTHTHLRTQTAGARAHADDVPRPLLQTSCVW